MEKELNILDILPKEWFDKNGKADIYVSAYHCLTDILTRDKKEYVDGQIFNSKFLIVNTILKYHNIDLIFKGLSNNSPQFNSNIQTKKTEQSVFLLFFLKHDLKNESKTIRELQSSRGLLSNIEGKNTNYWHVTDYIIHFPVNNTTTVSPVIKAPDLIPAFSKTIMVELVSQKINTLEITLQTRIKLALRWIDSAEHETMSLDEFLKLWFAIETISMPDTTNIKPLLDRLASIYNLDKKIAKGYFNVGLILKLRSNIVHNGLNIGIHFQLNQYLKAIFYDVLLDICEVPSLHAARQVLEDSKFDKIEWMPPKDILK